MLGKNVGFACHIFGRELCRNRSGTAFFGAWFRLRTFLYLGSITMKKALWLAFFLIIVCCFIFSACDNVDSPDDKDISINDNTSPAPEEEPIDISSFQGNPEIDIFIDIEETSQKSSYSYYNCIAAIKNNTGKTISELKLYVVECYDNQSPIESGAYTERLKAVNIDTDKLNRYQWSFSAKNPTNFVAYLAYIKYEDGTTWGNEEINHKAVITKNFEIDVCLYNDSTATTQQKFIVSYTTGIISNSHVGNNWSYAVKVDDVIITSNSIILTDVAENRGPRLTLYAQENDSNPETGKGKMNFPALKIGESMSLSQGVEVVENGGRYIGHKAVMGFYVTITRVELDYDGVNNGLNDDTNSSTTNNIAELTSVVEQLCFEYNRDFAYYNSYINATVNSATSITVEQTILDKIAPDDVGVVGWLEEGLIAFFEEGFESAEFPQKIGISVNSTYEIDEALGLLSAEYIDIYELQVLSGNDYLWFGSMASSYANYNLGIGNLVYGFYTSGIVSTELLFIYDMPENFAQEYNNEGVYSGIHFCIVEDMWCFNPQDLISVGLLNADGSFNEKFEPQAFDESKAKKEWESDWISASQLNSIYDYSWTWMGESAYLSNYYLNAKYTITGTPASSFGNDVVHSCSCNGFTVRIKYLNGDYWFFYDDLLQVGIVT